MPIFAQRLACTAAVIAAAVPAALLPAAPAAAVPVYVAGSGTGAVSFGVTGFAGVAGAVPLFIGNTFSGRQDILSYPGLFSSAFAPTIPNNIREAGPFPLANTVVQNGGGNINGPFGSGSIQVSPDGFGFSLSDANNATGVSHSYGVGSLIATYANPVAYVGSFGNFLSVSAVLPAIGSDFVAALRTFVTSANPASPFFGGVDLPALVLGAQRREPLLYASGWFGGTAQPGTGFGVISIDNPAAGRVRGLSFNNANIVIPAGDVFTVTSTLTILADPSTMDNLMPADVSDLLPAGESLPGLLMGSSITAVPEAATLPMMGLGLALLGLGIRARRPGRLIDPAAARQRPEPGLTTA